MIIRSVRHRGMRRLLENDSSRFLSQDLVDRVRNIMTALLLAEDIGGFIAEAPPGWRIPRLTGERRGTWSIAVSGNWRITFGEKDGCIEHLSLEDYH